MSSLVEFLMHHKLRIGAAVLGLAIVIGGGYLLLPSPAAHGALKGHTVEIARNAHIEIVFDQGMNHGSVEKAFKITPPVSGAFAWQGNVLVFQPAQSLDKGMTYVVEISHDAHNYFWKGLSEDFRQEFLIIDYPEVSVVAPADQSEIRTTQTLTVLFDHPLRSLTGSLAVPNMLKIEPPTKGVYHWLGTSGFEFIPDGGWTPATDFKVTVPKGTKTADGGSLVADYSWSFGTPRLTASLLSNSAHADPAKPFTLMFNAPVDPAVLRAALVIKDASTTLSNDQFTFGKDKDYPYAVTVKKIGNLRLGTTYELMLPKGWNANFGPKGLESAFDATVMMDDAKLYFMYSSPGDGAVKDVESSLELHFNNPPDEKTFPNNIRITPAVKDLELHTYNYYGADTNHTVYVSGRWAAATTYTVTLTTGIKDVYGQPLEQAKTFSIKTGDYRASAEVSSDSQFGMLDSYRPRLYQVRTMNDPQPVSADLCSGTYEQFLGGSSFGCDIKAHKSYDTTNPKNRYKIIDIDLDDLAGRALPNGFYTLTINTPGLIAGVPASQDRTVVISDTALTVKRDHDNKVLVWATDMKTGDVVSNLTVEAWTGMRYSTGEVKRIVSGTTDAQGLAILDAGDVPMNVPLSVRATGGGHLGYAATTWNDGISTWNYGLDGNYRSTLAHHIGYIYTDRRIYRPDQLVYFKGVIRKDVDAALSLPDAKDISVSILNPDGTQIQTLTLPLSEFGTFNGQLQLDPSMPLGTYSISVTLDSDAYNVQNITGTFDVREYRRPDFKVAIATPPGIVTSGQKVDIGVHAEYYYGGALSGAHVSYQVTRNALYFQPMRGEWYSYTNFDNASECYWYCPVESNFETVASGDGTLDANGNFTIDLPANLTDYKSSATYYVTATVTDLNQREVSWNADFPVHKGEFYLGIRPDYSKGWDAPTADFNIVSVNPDGAVRPNVPAMVKLYRRTWTSVKKVQADGTSSWEYQNKDDLIDTKAVTTGADAKADVSFAPSADGEYIAVAVTKDSRGSVVSASAERYIYRGFGATVKVTDDHQMKIVQNKADYNPGDTASLIVQTPYEQTKALMSIERDKIREYRVVDLGTKMRTVEVPIGDDAAPNIYVSVLAVKGGGATDIPEFRLGYADLRVNTTKKVLGLAVTPDKATYKPGEPVTLNVDAKKSDGSPAQAEVSLAVVDERVVALLGSIDKDILGRFWFERTIGVSTAQSLTQLVKKVFFATEGGAGDGKGGEGKVPPVRGNFLDTAYWKADVVTGADGKATVSFKLPDNLTSWQILAIGETKDTIVGSAEAKIVTRKDLMVEPLVPRILRLGDTLVVGGTIHNQTNAAFAAQASIEADGITVDGPKTRDLNLAANSRVDALWTVHVPLTSSAAKITIRVHGAGLDDGFELPLPVLPYSVPEIVTASGILQKTATEKIGKPEDVLPNAGEVNISVAPTVGNGLSGGLEYLLNYEYGCSEQTTSAYLASLSYEELVKQKLTKGNDALLKRAHDKITEGIKRVIPMQQPDGGFGYWTESDQSYAHLTAYVFWGLTRAEKAGYPVDPTIMQNADRYLREALALPSGVWSAKTLEANEKAQVLFMLSERNTDGLSGYASSLYDQKASLTSYGKAFLAMAIHNLETTISSARAATLLGEVRNKVVYLDPTRAYVGEDKGYDVYLSTDTRSTGIYLMALVRVDPSNADIEKLVHWLMREKRGGYWETTQNTAFTMLSLAAYAEAHPVDTTAGQVTVYLDNAVKGALKFPEGDVSAEQGLTVPLSEILKRDTTQVGLEKDSEKKYFYDISMKVFRQIENIEPFDNGFTVIADAYAMDDKAFEHPISQAAQGDTVRIRVKLLVPKRHRNVALEYHLPAGLEAIDFQLKTSPQNIAGQEKQCVPGWNGEQECFSQGDWEWNWWWENVWKHVELRDDRVFLFSEALEPGVYEYDFLAQAMTPGQFRVPPARAYEFYNPKANGHNEGKVFSVHAK